GAEVTVTDMKSGAQLREQVALLRQSVRLSLGAHPAELFAAAELVVVSPGVPMDIEPLSLARARGIPVIGELELAYEIYQENGSRAGDAFLAVTGANGKSTTTTLLDFMMRKAGFTTVLAGNIGNALSEELNRLGPGAAGREVSLPDFVVLEVSSFQLEGIRDFRPHVASLLNITPDHLDRYHSLAEYGAAKARIFERQDGHDSLVLNADDPETMRLYEELRKERRADLPQVFFFSRMKEVRGVHCAEGIIYADLAAGGGEGRRRLMPAAEVAVKGVHNLENAMAASAMALLAGCPHGAVIDALREFRGLEHRLEFVRELDGVRYFNDSKGTNVGAVIKSLDSFTEPLVLIAGGRDKAGDFSALRDLAAQRVKTLVLIGEAAGKIRDALADVTETVLARDLGDAVSVARSRAAKGDVVLLSPACASFDMFRDFEDRGRQFKEIVRGLNG
ncbi:MAG: UDP-N-acetylmuramoyl-L-alanine--D-glutamate ligase, partial [Nitrospiraceae bacterium]|nr:UDP-N-acetylmuramoyl-L-alanine--D-glutamate ligase [Nitrospiraceae bacterium]